MQQHDPSLQRQILDHPREQVQRPLPFAALALTRSQVPVWEKYAEKMASEENPDFMRLKAAGSAETEMRKLHIGFEGQLGTHVCSAHEPSRPHNVRLMPLSAAQP